MQNFKTIQEQQNWNNYKEYEHILQEYTYAYWNRSFTHNDNDWTEYYATLPNGDAHYLQFKTDWDDDSESLFIVEIDTYRISDAGKYEDVI